MEAERYLDEEATIKKGGDALLSARFPGHKVGLFG
jgi:hypothetical protein